MSYAGSAGKQSPVLGHWPKDSKLKNPNKDHLVMFIHPGCSCSKASLAELSRLMSVTDLTAQIVFMKSKNLVKLYEKNPLLAQAKLIPRTEIVFDDGFESKLFGAETSGLTHLYNQNSNLVFTGGLTMARGHEGDSLGKAAILSYLKGQKTISRSLVFGCDIFERLKTITSVDMYVRK